nr:FAD-dependent monooxygenase [Saccharopolyspora soli]
MTDVLIVGGGPVGLLLAGELRLAGVDPLVLEAADASSVAEAAWACAASTAAARRASGCAATKARGHVRSRRRWRRADREG